jgi:hypothetical protein
MTLRGQSFVHVAQVASSNAAARALSRSMSAEQFSFAAGRMVSAPCHSLTMDRHFLGFRPRSHSPIKTSDAANANSPTSLYEPSGNRERPQPSVAQVGKGTGLTRRHGAALGGSLAMRQRVAALLNVKVGNPTAGAA